MTVWVIKKDESKDMSDAERFGELVALTHRFTYPDELIVEDALDAGSLPFSVRTVLDRAAEAYDPLTDWLLPNGDVSHLAYMLLRVKQPVKLLRYDRKERAYVPIVVS